MLQLPRQLIYHRKPIFSKKKKITENLEAVCAIQLHGNHHIPSLLVTFTS